MGVFETVFGALIIMTCASFLIGIVIGYNYGFNECSEAYKKYSVTTSKGISGREYVEKYGECPICEDCPHNCPLEK